MTQTTEVLLPSSAEEAVLLFGDGSGVTVIAGGTVVVPQLTYRRLVPAKALLLARAGLDTLDVDGTTVTVGAGLPIERLASLAGDVKALAQCALNVADFEIRRQGTVGGNVCAGAGADAPRGDLQGPFLALDATAHSVGGDGESSEPFEEFLGHRDGRLLLGAAVREACRVGVRRDRLPAHARVHRARRDRRSQRRRGDPPGRDRARRPRAPPSISGSRSR